MGRALQSPDLEAALMAGLLLSAGGSGMKAATRHRRFGAEALLQGACELVSVEEIGPEESVLIATGVGAPGFASSVTEPNDALEAAVALVRASGARLSAVIPGHVPGTYAWFVAASLGLKLLDAAANGRGHPTVKLGGMGLASRPEVQLYQACANRHAGLEVVAHGNLVMTSNLMRAAAVQCGGLVMAGRGPFSADFVRVHGARDAISFQLGLGHAMLSVPGGRARVAAAVDYLGGELLCEGEVAGNDVAYCDGFDVGCVVVRNAAREVRLRVLNEFMMAEEGGKPLCAFPDLIGTLDPMTGDPVAISELEPGTPVSVIAASRNRIPLGAGVYDEAAYPEIVRALGTNFPIPSAGKPHDRLARLNT